VPRGAAQGRGQAFVEAADAVEHPAFFGGARVFGEQARDLFEVGAVGAQARFDVGEAGGGAAVGFVAQEDAGAAVAVLYEDVRDLDLAAEGARVLAQFTLSRAVPAVAAVSRIPIFNSPGAAVAKMRAMLQA
jgi:hypothetical protein